MAFNLKQFLFGTPTPQVKTGGFKMLVKKQTPLPASTARPKASQTSINKIYQSKLPAAIKQEERQMDWIGKTFTDRDWRKRAERNAMNQAINEEMNKTRDFKSPTIRAQLDKIKVGNQQATQKSQRGIQQLDKIQKNMQNFAQVAGYIPGFGAGMELTGAGLEQLGKFTGNKQLQQDAADARKRVTLNMSQQEFNKLDKDQQNKLQVMQNISLGASPLDFLGAGGIMKSGIIGTGKTAIKEAIIKKGISEATKSLLKQEAKQLIKKSIVPSAIGGAFSAGSQLYLTGKIDPLDVLKTAGTTGAASILFSPFNTSKTNVTTSLVDNTPKPSVIDNAITNQRTKAVVNSPELITKPKLMYNNSPDSIPGRRPINIHPDDARVMGKFIDSARPKLSGYNPKGDELLSIDLSGSTLAERYQIPMGKNKIEMANNFAKALEQPQGKTKVKVLPKIPKDSGFVNPGAALEDITAGVKNIGRELTGKNKTKVSVKEVPAITPQVSKATTYRSTHQIDSTTSRNLGELSNLDSDINAIKSKYGLTNYDQKDITNLKKIVGNPEAEVKIYRASPLNEINDGDWVTTSKTYANDIKAQNGGKVYEYTVKAKDLNLPKNIEDNPSLARFSAFQYKKSNIAPQVTKTPEVPAITPEVGKMNKKILPTPQELTDKINTTGKQEYKGKTVKSVEMTKDKNGINITFTDGTIVKNAQLPLDLMPDYEIRKGVTVKDIDNINKQWSDTMFKTFDTTGQKYNGNEGSSLMWQGQFVGNDAIKLIDAGKKPTVKNILDLQLSEKRITQDAYNDMISNIKSTPQPKPEVPAVTPTKPTKEVPIVGKKLTNKNQTKVTPKKSQQLQPKQPESVSQRPITDTARLLPNNVDNLSSTPIIPQPLQLSPAQAKQRFRKLNKEGTPFEIVNKDKSKPNKPFIAGETGIKKGGAEDIPDIDYTKFKDKSALGLGRETMERNLDRVAGKDAGKLKEFLVDSSRKNETDRTDFTNGLRRDIKKSVVEDLGIKPRSKESELVQKYGEKSITLEQLKQESPNNWQKITKASDIFRKQYDDLLDRWNAVRQQYGYDPVPKREDYFRHFQDLSETSNLVGIIKNQKDLPTSISGITDIFQPNKPFSNAELQRKGNKTTYDAVSGFDNYLDSVSRQIFHTDTVQRGRAIDNAIRRASETTPDVQLPNFVANLNEWTNLVAGKKTRIDRAAEQLLGRKVYGAANALRSRVGANMVGANISSALTNFVPFTQSLATTSKPAAVRGIMDTMASALKGNRTMIDGVKSNFLTRRFPEASLAATKTSKVVRLPFEAVDGFTSRSIVAGKYYENVSKGMSKIDAIKNADEYAGKLITDRSIGQLPNLLETKTTGFLTQFQTEVNNQVSFLMRDIPSLKGGNPAKIAGALAQVILYSYLYNEAYQQIAGRRVALDPLKMVLDLADENKDTDQKIESFKENILGGLPGTSIFTGGRLPISAAAPDFGNVYSGIKDIGTDNDAAMRKIYKGLSGPAAYLLPKTGGGQIKKTLDDLIAQADGYSQTPSGDVRFPMPTDLPNQVRGAVFGQYSTPGGQEYINNGTKPLTGEKAEIFKSIPKEEQTGYFETEMLNRATNKKDKAEVESLGKSSGTKTLKSGKVAYKNADGEWKIAKDQKTADKAVAKQKKDKAINSFEESGKNYLEKDGVVYRKDAEGKTQVTTKIKYDYSYNTEKLQSYKLNDNLNGYIDTAKKQLLNIQKQLNDPNIDPQEALKLENDAQTLMDNITKYTEYGGFTKPKAAKKTKSNTRLDYTKSMIDTNASMDTLRKIVKAKKITRKKVVAK
jgi:flavin-binding protein dodecin